MRSYHSVLALSILLSAVACTEDQSPTGPEATAAPELSATAAATLVFRAISAGDAHSCGVTTTNKAYCWGSNFVGALGDGGDFASNVPVAVAGGPPLPERQLGLPLQLRCHHEQQGLLLG